MKAFLILLLAVASTLPSLAAPASAPSYSLTLVTIQDSGEVVAVIGSAGFSTIESLKRYIADTLPAGSTISWRAADHPPQGWKKFTAAWNDLKTFCADRGGKFVIEPAPF